MAEEIRFFGDSKGKQFVTGAIACYVFKPRMYGSEARQ
jgi:hypothetical protein